MEREKNSLSSHDISKLVGNCTVISSSTFPPLYISSSPSFAVLFYLDNKQAVFSIWAHSYMSVVPLTLVFEDSAGPQQRRGTMDLQVDLAASPLCKTPKSVFICALQSSSIFFPKQGKYSLCCLI